MHNRPVNTMDNPNAERVKRVAQLAGRSAVRARRQRFLAEGPQSAREAIRAHLGLLDLSGEALKFWPREQTVAEVYYTARLASTDPELMDLIAELGHGVFVAETTARVLQAMSDAVVHQNIIVVANLPAAQSVPTEEGVLVAGLVRVQDPGNAGTIIRAADAAGAGYVFTTPDTVDIYNPKAVRATAGSLFHLPVYASVALTDFKALYRGQILAADGYGEVSLDHTEPSMLAHRTAWMFGNEARGLSAQELALADARVAVPLYGLAESLNVATAATICLYSSAMAQNEA